MIFGKIVQGEVEREAEPGGGQKVLRVSRVRTESNICPMFTRATLPFGLPHAPRIPVCNLSAPAHDNILLMRTT